MGGKGDLTLHGGVKYEETKLGSDDAADLKHLNLFLKLTFQICWVGIFFYLSTDCHILSLTGLNALVYTGLNAQKL